MGNDRSHALFLGVAAGLIAIALALLGISATVVSAQTNPGQLWWRTPLALSAYALILLAGLCVVGAVREWRFPGTDDAISGGTAPDVSDDDLSERCRSLGGRIAREYSRWRAEESKASSASWHDEINAKSEAARKQIRKQEDLRRDAGVAELMGRYLEDYQGEAMGLVDACIQRGWVDDAERVRFEVEHPTNPLGVEAVARLLGRFGNRLDATREHRSRRTGYRGRQGSKGNLSDARFGKDLDVGIDNAGEVDAPRAEFGVERGEQAERDDA